MLLQSIGALFLPWLLSFAGYAVYASKNPAWRKPLNSLITQLILVFLLPPLISFALYFCLWHSRSHTLRIWQSIEDDSERRRSFIEAAIYSLMAWTAALGLFIIFSGVPVCIYCTVNLHWSRRTDSSSYVTRRSGLQH